jgi:hypothetical protein
VVEPERPEGRRPKHRGWRVVGVPPNGCVSGKRVVVQMRPFEVRDAAIECAALAERAGWTQVAVIELIE